MIEDLDNAGDYVKIDSNVNNVFSPPISVYSSDIINISGTNTLYMHASGMCFPFDSTAWMNLRYTIPNNGSTPTLTSGELRVMQYSKP